MKRYIYYYLSRTAFSLLFIEQNVIHLLVNLYERINLFPLIVNSGWIVNFIPLIAFSFR